MSWMMGQMAPSVNLQITLNWMECLVDLPDGCTAFQKCLDRLKKWAGVFVMKFNMSCTLGRIIGSPIAGWMLACWKEVWLPGASHTDHEPKMCPHEKEIHQPVECIKPRIS